MASFNAVKRSRPDARLFLPAGGSEKTKNHLLRIVAPEWRKDVRFGNGAPGAVPEAFGRAAVSVLPSLWESFGMVVLESMSCGTPVVGTRHGALPELIPNESVGRLFDAGPLDGASPTNVNGLTAALLEGMEMSRQSETRQRCRAHAERFSWSVVGPKFEELYFRMATRARSMGEPATRPA